MKPVLLVIDIQNAWIEDKGSRESVEKHVGTVNSAIRWFRKKELPIVVISHEEPSRGVVPGTAAFQFFKAVEVGDTDTKITKRYPNSFAKTGLESLLRQEGCDTVVLCGQSAVWCVLATYFGAIDCDLTPYMLRDGIAASNEAEVQHVEKVYDGIDLATLEKKLSE